MGAVAFMGANMAMAGISGMQGQAMANYNNSIAQTNARLLEEHAGRVMEKGAKDEMDFRNQVNQMVGTQRVSMASAGVDIGTGTALAIQEETAEMGARDAREIRNNAFLEAQGFRQEALNKKFEGRAGMLAADNQLRNGLITAGMQGYSMGKR